MSNSQQAQREIQRVVDELVREQQAVESHMDRRDSSRVVFIQPVTLLAEDGREMRMLSRDLSDTGIRLLGSHRLLGQKVEVLIMRPSILGSSPEEQDVWSFTTRILWTCEVGDNLYENGGHFLQVRTLE